MFDSSRRLMVTLVCGCALLLAFTLGSCAETASEDVVHVGSKKFTESVVLGETLKLLAEDSGLDVEHRSELGSTQVVFKALEAGDIDLYPEYTGTIAEEILSERPGNLAEMRSALAARGIAMSDPLGFNNTYALGMTESRAKSLNITSITDLNNHPNLVLGFSGEFVDRADGWPAVRATYGLVHRDVRGMDHDLAYRGLAAGDLDLTDLYSTDAEIDYHNLRVLADDRQHFPRYDAVILYRSDLAERAPRLVSAIHDLEGQIGEVTMIAANRRAKIDKVSETEAAAELIDATLGKRVAYSVETWQDRLITHTAAHIFLVAVSLFFAVLIAIPLGVLAAESKRVGRGILGAVGILQTVPSLALLVVLVPLVGIGALPAIVALFIYSLLPIVQNTHSGLTGIEMGVVESAIVLGLPWRARMRRVLLPLAAPTIIAGIKTAAVINVGTATLGALIGAGGYGQPILAGIRKDDTGLILEGAVPAAVLALLVQGLLGLWERRLRPAGPAAGSGR